MLKLWVVFASLFQPGLSLQTPTRTGRHVGLLYRSSVKQLATADVTLTQTILEVKTKLILASSFHDKVSSAAAKSLSILF